MKEKEKYFTIFKNWKRMSANLICEMSNYGWGDDFCRNQTRELYKKLIQEFSGIDFTQFTIEELKDFDFRMWDENTILMPIWAIDCIEHGTKLTSLDGEEVIFDKEKGLDKDVRFGCTAWGFSKSQLRDSAINSVLGE